MAHSLTETFYYGRSGWPSPFSPAGAVVYGIPNRLDKLHSLGESQIREYKKTAAMASESRMQAAGVIAMEIQQQSEMLSLHLDDLQHAITANQEGIIDAFDQWGAAICANLNGIRWEIAQTGKTLRGILAVLRNSRNNEARQLVEQGVRLMYVLGEMAEAEERFTLALQLDKTDHQVLRNLGYIYLHKEEPNKAIEFFRRSMLLPAEIDPSSKASTLDEIARVYYAEAEYSQALTFALEALNVSGEQNAQRMFDTACYAALSDKSTKALELLEGSILVDSRFFARASVEPDLENVRVSIMDLLSKLAIQAQKKALDLHQSALRIHQGILATAPEGMRKTIDALDTKMQSIAHALDKPSYSDLRLCAAKLNSLLPLLIKAATLRDIYNLHVNTEAELSKLQSDAKQLNEPIKPNNDKFVNAAVLFATSASYMIVGIMVANTSPFAETGFWLSKFVLWPLYWVPSLLVAIFGERSATKIAGAGFEGLVISLVFCFILWQIGKVVIEQRSGDYERALRPYQETMQEKKKLEATTKSLNDELNDLEANILHGLSSFQPI